MKQKRQNECDESIDYDVTARATNAHTNPNAGYIRQIAFRIDRVTCTYVHKYITMLLLYGIFSFYPVEIAGTSSHVIFY